MLVIGAAGLMFQFTTAGRAGGVQTRALPSGLLKDLSHFIVRILIAANLAANFETPSGGADSYLTGFAMQAFH